MRAVRRSYYLLAAIILLPFAVYFFGAMSEFLYSVISLAILGCFLAVIYCVKSERRSNTDANIERHLHRQITVVMSFVIAGIISAWHFYVGYSGRFVMSSSPAELLALGIYLVAIAYLLFGAVPFLNKHGFRR